MPLAAEAGFEPATFGSCARQNVDRAEEISCVTNPNLEINNHKILDIECLMKLPGTV